MIAAIATLIGHYLVIALALFMALAILVIGLRIVFFLALPPGRPD